jgi:hypothetical protein
MGNPGARRRDGAAGLGPRLRIPIEFASSPTEFAPSLRPWIVDGKRRSKLQNRWIFDRISSLECVIHADALFAGERSVSATVSMTVIGIGVRPSDGSFDATGRKHPLARERSSPARLAAKVRFNIDCLDA